jgi:hypothetical protein
VDAQVDQDELVPDDIRSYVEEVHRQLRIELDVRFPGQWVRTARLHRFAPTTPLMLFFVYVQFSAGQQQA